MKTSCLLCAVAVVSTVLAGPVQARAATASPTATIGCGTAADTHDAGYRAFATAIQDAGIPGAQLLHGTADSATLYCVGVKRSDGNVAVDAQTVFQAASLSKVVGAYVALRLVDAGVLDLDTPLWQYWPSPRLQGNVPAQTITARMVLSHTSGLPNWQISPADPAIDQTPLESLFVPGQAFAYSGEGFYLLQRTLEHLTGKAWEELAREQAFAPLGMDSSHYLATPRFNVHKAYGHHADGLPERERVFSWENTAWTLSTTASDYHRFLTHGLFNGDGLTVATHAAMLSAASDAIDPRAQVAPDPRIAWGLGVGLQNDGGRRLVWHWGDNPGFKAFFALDRDRGQHLVLLSNSENGPATYRQLLQRFLGPGDYPALAWIDAQP
jgi:CubicO group peptidase (beta-lactamase class C family)